VDRRAEPSRGWLAGVLRNLVRQRRRAEARRDRREQLSHARDAVTSPAAALERVELQRLVAELVAELPEPGRHVVVLRYFEELSAAEIARIEGVPAGTVRSRLKRALDALRIRLDEEHGNRRSAWIVPLAAVARPRVAPAPTGTGLIGGIIVMATSNKTLLTAAAVLAAIAVGTLSLRSFGASDAPQTAREADMETDTAAAAGDGPALPPPVSPADAPAEPRARVRATPATTIDAPTESADVAPVEIVGRVVHVDGTPFDTARVEALGSDAQLVRATDVETSGRFRVVSLASDADAIVELRVRAPGYTTRRIAARGGESGIAIVLAEAVPVRVSTRDWDGTALSDQEVVLRWLDMDRVGMQDSEDPNLERIVRTDDAGVVTIPDFVPDGATVAAIWHGSGTEELTTVFAPVRDGRLELDLQRPEIRSTWVTVRIDGALPPIVSLDVMDEVGGRRTLGWQAGPAARMRLPVPFRQVRAMTSLGPTAWHAYEPDVRALELQLTPKRRRDILLDGGRSRRGIRRERRPRLRRTRGSVARARGQAGSADVGARRLRGPVHDRGRTTDSLRHGTDRRPT